MMKIFKFILLFIFVTVGSFFVTVAYFKVHVKVSTLNTTKFPSISFSDILRYSNFSLEKAPSQSLVGKIISLNGEVFYESRTSSESAKITNPINVQQGESLATGTGGNVILNYADAVDITISPMSSVNIIQTIPNDLVFQQTLGSIKYNKLSQIPVSIRVGHLLVENDGIIIISFTKDSPITTVEVIDGSANTAFNNLNNDSQLLNLKKGQILRFNESNRRANAK
jgi:hypothetical protein